jgi:hypothetical protein
MHALITTEAGLDALPAGSVVASPFPDMESNVAERTSDLLWLITGEITLLTSDLLFDSADTAFVVLRHGYDDEQYSNLDRAIKIAERIDKLLAVRSNLRAAFAGKELEGGHKAAFDHPLWHQADAEIARLRDSLTLLV